MHRVTPRSRWLGLGGVVFFIFICSVSPALPRQTSSDFAAQKQQADALYAQNKLEDALKIYEKLAANSKADVSIFSHLGFLLYSEISTTRDEQRRKDFADRARIALARAKELGDQTALTNTLISSLANGTPAPTHYSDVVEADAAMQQAEILYMKGELAAAIDLYKKALGEDPKLFDAALYSGDVYYKMPGKQEEAQEWFAKAVAIDPNRSIAYRYWADDLMKLGKVQEAKEKYIEAYITQPNDRLVVATLAHFAKGQNITLSQAIVKIPVTVAAEADGYVVTVQAGALNNPDPVRIPFKVQMSEGRFDATLSPEMSKNAALMAWLRYAGARIDWTKKYLDAHPNQTSVRNNLIQEAFALRAAVSQLDENAKDLDPSLVTLMKLDKDGLLEAFILMARSDQGIAQDYPAYLTAHRDLLRRYVVNWLFTNGGAQK